MKLVCIGDSITRGGLWIAKPICNRLCERYPQMDVINLGVAGDSTAGVLARMSDADKYKPFRVLVWIGINDVASGISAATMQGNLQAIYTYYAASVAEVWALTITARDDNTGAMVTVRDTVNSWIKNTATGLTRVIDACAITADPNNTAIRLAAYADPGSPNHLNDAGIAALVAAMP